LAIASQELEARIDLRDGDLVGETTGIPKSGREIAARARELHIGSASGLREVREVRVERRMVFGSLEVADDRAPQMERLLDRADVRAREGAVARDVVVDDEVELASDVPRQRGGHYGHAGHQHEQPERDREDLQPDRDRHRAAPHACTRLRENGKVSWAT